MIYNKLSPISRLLLIVASILLFFSIFVPIWRIELDAPQYPEGLAMLIYANKLGGDVEIINGLNHYIGMQTLHAENFIEFSILVYIIGAYALFCLIVAYFGRKKMLYTLFGSYILFGIVAMTDFWRWEYNYGHNLDPTAAIIVPGMAYQPPLIGFKQLLNFGAYSIPDTGGWLFVASGLLMLVSVLLETNVLHKLIKNRNMSAFVLPVAFFGLLSCQPQSAEPIHLNKDQCDYCKMTISDGRFATEMITDKGRIYKFDDLGCMVQYKKENSEKAFQSFYVSDYTEENQLIKSETAIFLQHDEFKSPMGGNTAAFLTIESADNFATKLGIKTLNWQAVNK
jgi:copper chaperone NosL